MKLFLNNLLKGLLTAFVVICLGGFISLNIKVSPTNAMVLVSSSLVNSIKTEANNNIEESTSTSEDIEEEVDEVDSLDTDVSINLEIEENTSNIQENIQQENTNDSSNNNQTIDTNQDNQTINTDTDIDTSNTINQDNNDNQNIVTIQGNYEPNLEVLNTISTIETYYGKITAYGPDCYGCTSGRTASGQYVKDGNIYYQDQTFGNIRIVAADSSLPFGSIIKITGLNISSDPLLAIVLDRGGAIGFSDGKHAYFDLLYATEKDASTFGIQNATFELLRKGY